MKNRFFDAVILMIIMTGVVLANHTAITGGLRDGIAMGMRTEFDLTRTTSLRLSMLGSTGDDLSFAQTNPLILVATFDTFLTRLSNKCPLEIGVGIVDYSGNNSQVGPTLHVIADNFNGDKNLYGEAGIDFIDRGRFQILLGYKIWTTYSPVANPY